MKLVMVAEYRSLRGIIHAGATVNVSRRFGWRLIHAGLARELPLDRNDGNKLKWQQQKIRQFAKYKSCCYF
jgi:hypothetical protein